MQSTTCKKKGKQTFQTKKDFVTCSKLIINEPGRCPTRSDNVYFANNEQASLAFTAAFCFAHAEHNLIKLKLYINWSAQAMIFETQANQSNCWPLKLANQSALNKGHVMEITKAYKVTFMIARNSLAIRYRQKLVKKKKKKTEYGANLFF